MLTAINSRWPPISNPRLKVRFQLTHRDRSVGTCDRAPLYNRVHYRGVLSRALCRGGSVVSVWEERPTPGILPNSRYWFGYNIQYLEGEVRDKVTSTINIWQTKNLIVFSPNVHGIPLANFVKLVEANVPKSHFLHGPFISA